MKKIIFLFYGLLYSINSFSNESQKYEIRTAPIALLARWYTADLSFNLNNKWALGPSIIIYNAPKIGNMFAPSFNGTAIGAHAYYYFESFSEPSWYLGAHAYLENYEAYPHNFNGHYEFKGSKTNIKMGYQFTPAESVNLMFGAGAEYRNYEQKNFDDSAGINTPAFKEYQKIIPYLEVKLGYQF